MKIYRDPNTPIKATLGETFVVALESNPTTGYEWKEAYDASLITLTGGPNLVPRPSSIGGGGEEQFEFQATRAGETLITLNYKREWEDKPRKTAYFQVHIAA